MKPFFIIEEKNKISKDALLRSAVEKCGFSDLEYAVSKTGKPYFKNSDLCFSKSDTKNYIAVAVADTDIGIDIEETNRKVDTATLSARFFCEEEREYVASHKDKSYAFLKIWTRKEALLKADGIGIRVELSSFNTVPDTVIFNNNRYTFLETETDRDIICSICVKNNLLD